MSRSDGRTLRGQGDLRALVGDRRDVSIAADAHELQLHPGALPLRIDDVVDKRYQITGIVGRGGFGAVYSARHLVSGADVAIKVLLARPQGNREEAVERFFKEARVLAKLKHPNTVRVHDVGYTEAGDLYFAMELLDGPNLEQVFAELARHGRVLTEAQAIDVMIPVLGALGEAHKLDLVHRDLKPANVILAHVPNEPFCVKVLDFGVVRTADSDLTTRQTALGTPIYMSPEQCASGDIDGRSDLYAVATILFEAVSGRTPYPPGNPIDVMFEQMNGKVPDVRKHSQQKHSPGFVLLLRKALAKDPERRFQDATEMRETLKVIRRESWPDVPVTHLDMLLSRGEQRRLSSTFRVVVGKIGDDRGMTEAGVRVGAASSMAELPMALRDESDQTVGGQGAGNTDVLESAPVHDTRVDLDRPGTGRTRYSPASRLPFKDAERPHSPSAMPKPRRRPTPRPTPQQQAALQGQVGQQQAGQHQFEQRPVKQRPAFRDDSRVAKEKLPTGASQAVVRLPSQTEIASAIERHLREKAQKRSEQVTQVNERDSDPARLPQMAPPADGDSRELPLPRGSTKLGKGTMIGTGFPVPSSFRDDDD